LPTAHEPPERLVERLVILALICILFDGGLHLGGAEKVWVLNPQVWSRVLSSV
jgi:hypothetical protein